MREEQWNLSSGKGRAMEHSFKGEKRYVTLVQRGKKDGGLVHKRKREGILNQSRERDGTVVQRREKICNLSKEEKGRWRLSQ
jgi:hypothetical protein